MNSMEVFKRGRREGSVSAMTPSAPSTAAPSVLGKGLPNVLMCEVLVPLTATGDREPRDLEMQPLTGLVK